MKMKLFHTLSLVRLQILHLQPRQSSIASAWNFWKVFVMTYMAVNTWLFQLSLQKFKEFKKLFKGKAPQQLIEHCSYLLQDWQISVAEVL